VPQEVTDEELEAIMPTDVEALVTEPEIPMCTYTEYDPESGETYGCRLREHGPKVKHQRGEKL
jgi:hypothetical protein